MATSPDGNELPLATNLVHGSEKTDAQFSAVARVLVRSKTYQQPEFGADSKWKYARGTKATRIALQDKLESVQDESQATVFSSGLAASGGRNLRAARQDQSFRLRREQDFVFSQQVFFGPTPR